MRVEGWGLIALAAALGASAALAQEPTRTTATYEDWMVQCRQVAQPAKSAEAAPSNSDVQASAAPAEEKAKEPAKDAGKDQKAAAAKSTGASSLVGNLFGGGSSGEKTPGASKLCEMIQVFTFQRTGQQLAKIAIGRLPGESKVKAVLQVPLGVYLPAGATIKLDDKPELKGQFIQCGGDSCLADFDLPDDASTTFGAAKQAVLTFTNAARQPISLRMSVRGFEAALKAALSGAG